MQIREAEVAEFPLLLELALRSKGAWGYSTAFLATCRQELTLGPEQRGDAFVIEDGEAGIVAFCALEAPVADEEDLELGWLFVAPDSMRTGLGSALVRDACARARARGYRGLLLAADPNAERFYLAMGAKLVGARLSDQIPDRILPLFRIAL